MSYSKELEEQINKALESNENCEIDLGNGVKMIVNGIESQECESFLERMNSNPENFLSLEEIKEQIKNKNVSYPPKRKKKKK